MLGSARAKSKTLTEAAQQEIRDAIARGTFRPGSQIPPENELVEILGVSRTVVREALRGLEEDGLITRRHGVGTFVRKSPILQNLTLNFGTTEMIRSAGMSPGTRDLAVQTLPADDETAKALNLRPGTPVVSIERVRTADGRPVVYSVDMLPMARAGDFNFAADWPPGDGSLYQLLQSCLGLIIEYGVARLLPLKAPAHVADRLGIARDSVLLYLIQTDYSPDDEPVLYSREHHLPDAFDFMILRRGQIRPAETASPTASA